jgi:hypothetical protein
MQIVRICVFLASVFGNEDFWSKINDESMTEVMEHSPGFKQMIQSTCEMITLGRAGYPKNIPRDTVDKLCTKMYPPYANRGKKMASGVGEPTEFSTMNAAVLVVVTLGMIYYVVSSSTPDEAVLAQPPPAWEINRLARDTPTAPAASQVKAAQSPAHPAGVLSPPAQTVSSPASPASPESVATPTADQVLAQRRARLSRFDSQATEQSNPATDQS